MELFYYKEAGGNFGDDLNEWIWDRLVPGWREAAPDTTLVGIGTILNKEMLPVHGKKVVLGSGAGYGTPPDLLASPGEWDVRFVRGPKTAEILGLKDKAVCDPAILISDFKEFSSLCGERSGKIFVPHVSSINMCDWQSVTEGTDLEVVLPSGDARDIIKRIAGAEYVIAESMHAAIIADAFRTPWRPVVFSQRFLELKWTDWMSSLSFSAPISHELRAERKIIEIFRKAQRMVRGENRGLVAFRERSEADTKYRSNRLLHNLLRSKLTKVSKGPHFLSPDRNLAVAKERMYTELGDFMSIYF